jgi:hypothetical protein
MIRILPFLTLIATAGFLISPMITDPFSGFDPARFPVPQVDPPVQPAGYAFGIWGLIYLWLGVSALAGVMGRRGDRAWARVQIPLVLSLGPGAFWLWLAGVNPPAATALILWMTGCALWALFAAPRRDRWLLQAPVALYAGWLTAASAVSIGVQLGGYGVFTPDWAAVVALGGGVMIALSVALTLPHAPEYALAVIWALLGVLVANLGGSLLVLGVAGAALLAMGAVAVFGRRAGQGRAAL